VHGLSKGQIDPTAGVIKLFQRLHLAKDVKVVSEKQLAAKQA
jgi:fatty-acid desaturase